MTKEDFNLPFGAQPAPQLWTAGQPTPEQLTAMKAAGLRHIINLRPESEDAGFDETAIAASLGLSHQRLPVSGPQDLTRSNAEALDRLLAQTGGEKTLVHCASSNRVGALFALRAAWIQGKPAEEALAIGRSHGLTKMEGAISSLLAAPP